MSHSECIISALRTFRESTDSVLHPVLSESFAAACDDLVGISLMAYIKHELILRSVIHIMKSDHEFHSSEA